MNYQLFKPYLSTLTTKKLLFVEVGDGSRKSGSFFINAPSIDIRDGEAVFECLDMKPNHPEEPLTVSFHLRVKFSENETTNGRTVLRGTIEELEYNTESLAYKRSSTWEAPKVGSKVTVHIEEPIDTSLTQLGLIIDNAPEAELRRLRAVANSPLTNQSKV